MTSESRGYENYLNHRKSEISTLLWVSRQIKPKISYKQTPRPTPQSHKEAVVQSRKIQELLIKLSETQNVPKIVLEKQVRVILDEVGYHKNLKLIRWLGYLLTKIVFNCATGLFVNSEYLVNYIKPLMGDCPVIIVPSHRSYADFILMASLCFTFDIEIPAVAAGMDFHGMWGMGSMLRHTGAFFMRRTYNDDSLYWTTFKQYVYQLVTKGDLPIEFFIEGTRSRSGKSLVPKYGLISMILKAFFLGEVPDILFIPVHIAYDRTLEENLFAFELLGVPKPKESTSGFFKSLKILKENFGNNYFHFAEPISAKKCFGNNLDRSVHNMQPLHLQEITEDEKSLIPQLAHEIVLSQQKHSIITTFNLISVILNNNLACNEPLIDLSGLIAEVNWFKSILESLGAFVHMENGENSILEAFDVHSNKIKVLEDGRVSLVWTEVVLDKMNASKFKAHALHDKTMTLAVPFVMLQMYINPLLHYLIDAALVVVILRRHRSLEKNHLFDYYHFLRYLFSMEFVTFGPREKLEFETAINHALELRLITLNNDVFELGNNKKLETVLYNCIEPFMVSYYTLCCVLETVPDFCDEKTILKNVQMILENALNENRKFVHPYSLSLDSLSNCLSVLTSNQNLTRSRRNNAAVYEINRNGVKDVLEKLEIYISSVPIELNPSKVQLFLENKL